MRARRATVLATLLLAACGGADDVPAGGGPSGSTLRATLADRDGDGALSPAAGERFAERTELAPARRPGRVLGTLGQLTDTHVRDEESPGRAPFLDRFGGARALDLPPPRGAVDPGARRRDPVAERRASPTRCS
jgi:hypothetical protein